MCNFLLEGMLSAAGRGMLTTSVRRGRTGVAMGPLLGTILVIVGVGVVILGMNRDLRICHTERQRSIVWTFTIGAVATAIIATVLARLLPFWLAWLAWVGLVVAMVWGVRWLQASLAAMNPSDEAGTESA